MFKDLDPNSNLTEAIYKHYLETLGVKDFKKPEDLERLRKQVRFDLLEIKRENSPWT